MFDNSRTINVKMIVILLTILKQRVQFKPVVNILINN